MSAADLRPFFEPRTVAVVGASRRRGRVGAEIFHNLTAGGFNGRVIPVNPRAHEVAGVAAYAEVSQIPGHVDLAIIAVPAACVDAAVDDCLVKGVPALVVITAGFGETGDDGRAREAALRERVRAAGARLIGPNCMGLLNTDPAVRLNATFSPVWPAPGSLAFSSQSGAVGLAVLDRARRLDVGLSAFASLGNKADVSTNDLLEFWGGDPRTRVILLYVESFGNPRRFSRLAREVSRLKPIVAFTAGRSEAGRRAATSHTGALAAGDAMVDALFEDCGVIRADTLEELFDVGRFLSQQPLPAGPRVAILTNAGGPAILAADACETLGLTLPPLSPATIDALRAFLPEAASVSNPVDMLATAPADHYARALPLLLADPAVDSVIVVFVPPLVTAGEDVARAIAGAARGAAKPILAALVGGDGAPAQTAPVPGYAFAESAARTLARVMPYVRWRAAAPGRVPFFEDVHLSAARAIVEGAPLSRDGWLRPLDALALLEAFGITHVPTVPVTSEPQARDRAHRLGFPVALKGAGAAIVHKSEAHAVSVGLITDADVDRAYGALAGRLGRDLDQVLLQPMAHGAEFLVGAVLDPAFGHVIVCGSGGTTTELVRDTACRLHPLTDAAAQAMLDGVRATAMLRGFRGAPPGGEAALRDVLLRISALVDVCPEIVELDLNPVMVGPAGATVADARIRIGRTAPGPATP
jgi:acetyl coenzyme A synthetase (ADP forming)-like protein